MRAASASFPYCNVFTVTQGAVINVCQVLWYCCEGRHLNISCIQQCTSVWEAESLIVKMSNDTEHECACRRIIFTFDKLICLKNEISSYLKSWWQLCLSTSSVFIITNNLLVWGSSRLICLWQKIHLNLGEYWPWELSKRNLYLSLIFMPLSHPLLFCVVTADRVPSCVYGLVMLASGKWWKSRSFTCSCLRILYVQIPG